MTTEQQADLTRLLATEVMGYTESTLMGAPCWRNKNFRAMCFEPFDDMNDAIRLLSGDWLDDWNLCPDKGVIECEVIIWRDETMIGFIEYADTPQAAICLAVARAHGWKGETETEHIKADPLALRALIASGAPLTAKARGEGGEG